MITGPRRTAAALAGVAAVVLTGCGTAPEDGAGATSSTAIGSPPPASTAPASPSPSASAGGPSTAPPADPDVTAIDVTVSGGQVQGVSDRVETEIGSTVRLTVTADTADEVHVHGYDLYGDVAPGQPATVEFTADIPGVFEVELHDSGDPLFALQVG